MPLEAALPACADPHRHARLLSMVREATLSGGRPPAPPRGIIAESWRRVRGLGVDSDRGSNGQPLDVAEVERRRAESRLAEVLDTLRHGLVSLADDGNHIMVVADAEGCLLWREGRTGVRSNAESLGFVEGAVWDEASVGTNGIGTALVSRHPLQVFGAEHYVRTHHPWICTAAPLHDPVDGRLLGVVDVSGPVSTAHPSTLGLVSSVTHLAEARLRMTHGTELASLRAVAAPVLARIAGPAVVTDRHGWVAAAADLLPPDRVTLPDDVERGAGFVPGLGHCRFEPLFDGWLVRVDPAESDRPTTLRLDLRGDPPSVVVAGPSGRWRHRLSRRHAEILFVLARRPGGCSAAELSAELFGDSAHTVTVRAEMSRLRRRLGSVVGGGPYRIQSWLDVACLLPDDPADLLPGATAPAVRAHRAGAP